MNTMILFHGEPNGPSLAALAMVEETGLPVECRKIDLLGGESHTISAIAEPLARDMVVQGEGPVLVVTGADAGAGEGAEAMTESVFIAQFLDEVAESGLQPSDPYAHWEMLMWCRRMTERCSPAAAFLGCRAYAQAPLAAMAQADFDALCARIVSDDLRARWSMVRAGAFPAEAVADSEAKIADAVVMVEEQLADGRTWLMDGFSIADLETYAWLAGMPTIVPHAFAGKTRAADWMARVRSRPSVQRALARSDRPDPENAWAPGPEINRWG